MTHFLPERYLLGERGDACWQSGRVAHLVLRMFPKVGDLATALRDRDPEAAAQLVALRAAALNWAAGRGVDCATSHDEEGAAQPPSWLSTAQAARRLGISPAAVRKAITDGRVPALCVGGRWVLAEVDVEQWRALRERRAA